MVLKHLLFKLNPTQIGATSKCLCSAEVSFTHSSCVVLILECGPTLFEINTFTYPYTPDKDEERKAKWDL